MSDPVAPERLVAEIERLNRLVYLLTEEIEQLKAQRYPWESAPPIQEKP